MIDIKALRQQKADLVKKNSSLLEAAESANRDLTAAEKTEYEANLAAVASLSTRIERAEQQMDAERNAPAIEITAGHDRGADKPWGSLTEQLQAVKSHATSKGSYTDPRLHAAALGGNESVDAEGGLPDRSGVCAGRLAAHL